MHQWEYQIIDLQTFGDVATGKLDALQEHLNTLGRVGWELTGSLPVTNDGDTRHGLLFLKRPRLVS